MFSIDEIDFKTVSLISSEQAHTYRLVPLRLSERTLSCYAPRGQTTGAAALGFLLGKDIEEIPIPPEEFDRLLARHYPHAKPSRRLKPEIKEESDIIRFVRKVMDEAASMGASDIHIERYETYARIRYRWKGQLVEKFEVPLEQYNAIVSRIKILAELDISERRLPQDGRINIQSAGRKIDIRVSTMPSKFGEKVVMRLLSRSQQFLQLENLGMQTAELERFRHSLHHQNGIILITGPTGSGKTTTLYAALSLLNKPKVNISTVEDPIEYNIEGFNQVQVKEEIGMTFGKALRGFMRQDPNIIMVGEIRDRETAETAIRAAMTGHLVFSTLHTNSAWDAAVRLIDMGVEPYLLASVLRIVMAQRLLRILCPDCKRPSAEAIPEHISHRFELNGHHEAVGCPACHYTGYRRQKGIYEALPITKELGKRIKALDLEIEDHFEQAKIKTLGDHAAELVREGETSLEEAMMYLI